MEHACCAQAHRKVIAARFVFVDAKNRNDGKLGNTFFLVFFLLLLFGCLFYFSSHTKKVFLYLLHVAQNTKTLVILFLPGFHQLLFSSNRMLA